MKLREAVKAFWNTVRKKEQIIIKKEPKIEFIKEVITVKEEVIKNVV